MDLQPTEHSSSDTNEDSESPDVDFGWASPLDHTENDAQGSNISDDAYTTAPFPQPADQQYSNLYQTDTSSLIDASPGSEEASELGKSVEDHLPIENDDKTTKSDPSNSVAPDIEDSDVESGVGVLDLQDLQNVETMTRGAERNIFMDNTTEDRPIPTLVPTAAIAEVVQPSNLPLDDNDRAMDSIIVHGDSGAEQSSMLSLHLPSALHADVGESVVIHSNGSAATDRNTNSESTSVIRPPVPPRQILQRRTLQIFSTVLSGNSKANGAFEDTSTFQQYEGGRISGRGNFTDSAYQTGQDRNRTNMTGALVDSAYQTASTRHGSDMTNLQRNRVLQDRSNVDDGDVVFAAADQVNADAARELAEPSLDLADPGSSVTTQYMETLLPFQEYNGRVPQSAHFGTTGHPIAVAEEGTGSFRSSVGPTSSLTSTLGMVSSHGMDANADGGGSDSQQISSHVGNTIPSEPEREVVNEAVNDNNSIPSEPSATQGSHPSHSLSLSIGKELSKVQTPENSLGSTSSTDVQLRRSNSHQLPDAEQGAVALESVETNMRLHAMNPAPDMTANDYGGARPRNGPWRNPGPVINQNDQAVQTGVQQLNHDIQLMPSANMPVSELPREFQTLIAQYSKSSEREQQAINRDLANLISKRAHNTLQPTVEAEQEQIVDRASVPASNVFDDTSTSIFTRSQSDAE